jgi:hypothetical protein
MDIPFGKGPEIFRTYTLCLELSVLTLAVILVELLEQRGICRRPFSTSFLAFATGGIDRLLRLGAGPRYLEPVIGL